MTDVDSSQQCGRQDEQQTSRRETRARNYRRNLRDDSCSRQNSPKEHTDKPKRGHHEAMHSIYAIYAPGGSVDRPRPHKTMSTPTTTTRLSTGKIHTASKKKIQKKILSTPRHFHPKLQQPGQLGRPLPAQSGRPKVGKKPQSPPQTTRFPTHKHVSCERHKSE
jgi:hypothetical protein